jgi:hypothetical protein
MLEENVNMHGTARTYQRLCSEAFPKVSLCFHPGLAAFASASLSLVRAPENNQEMHTLLL